MPNPNHPEDNLETETAEHLSGFRNRTEVPNHPKEPVKHTPGEWEIERPCGFPYTGIYIVSHRANNDKDFHHFIAEVRQLREHEESLANARLIAAAPKMLELLRELYGEWREYVDTPNDWDDLNDKVESLLTDLEAQK